MRTALVLTLLTAVAAPASAVAAPASAQHIEIRRVVHDTVADQTTERERELERARIERERARLERERDQERARLEREREQERARLEREREQERVRLERERDLERARLDRERAARERAAQQRQSGPAQTERITRTLRLGSSGELNVANVSGDIVITRGSGNEATVEAIKTARAATEQEARELLQLVQIDFVERGNRAEIRTRYPEWDENRRSNRRNLHVSVAFTITVPAGTRVRAHSVSGSVSAKDIRGEVALESVSGTVRIANGGRVASAKSISGNAEVIETDVEGMLEASTVSGTVLLRRVKAGQLDVGSISGSIVLDDVECPRVEAQTVSGDVRFGGPLGRNSRFEMTSHSGNLTVAIGGGAGFQVEARSFSGAVRSDFPLTVQGSDDRRRPRSIRGVYGDGSAVLDLTTFSGNIVISKR